jgi:hypothetical protein
LLEGVDVVAAFVGDDVAAFALVGVFGYEVLVFEDCEVALDLEEAEVGFVHEVGFDHGVKIAQAEHLVDDFVLAAVTKGSKGQNRKLS